MIDRCEQPSRREFKYYGGRGIQVYHGWRRSFERFLADVGERPPGTTLDRIDSDGHYKPSNVRWATPAQQQANRQPRS